MTRDAFGALVEALGEAVTAVDLSPGFAHAVDFHRTIMEVEMAHNLQRDYEKFGDQLSDKLRQPDRAGERSQRASTTWPRQSAAGPLNASLDEMFNEYDAILTPAAPGEPPMGLESTGNPIFCTIWTYLGTPAVSLPLLQSEAGLADRCSARRHGVVSMHASCVRHDGWSTLSPGPGRRGKKAGKATAAPARGKGKS